MTRILIIGATSAIAQATARQLVDDNSRFYLVGRNAEHVEFVRQDLAARTSHAVTSTQFDLNNISEIPDVIMQANEAMTGIDVCLIAHGTLTDQTKCEDSLDYLMDEFKNNSLSTIAVMESVAKLMIKQRKGTIAVISSVAGDRGRKSNYAYGSAKGAVSLYAQGLRNRLASKNVHVLTIKPGMVDTPMTVDFKKGILWSSPDKIAAGIVKAIEKKYNVVYLPGYWWFIMKIIKAIPESLFKRMNL